jgi:hypothetical protein
VLLRKAVSDKVSTLFHLDKHPDLIQRLINKGVESNRIDAWIKRQALKDPIDVDKEQLKNDLKHVFSIGGVISGGAALAYHLKYKTKDFDFYFNDLDSFVRAHIEMDHNPYIDICWYFDKPHELHDISAVMVNLYEGGKLEITEQARSALDTKIAEIYVENVIWPERTAKRLIKYNNRLGLRYLPEQIIALSSIYNLDDDLTKLLLETCA